MNKLFCLIVLLLGALSSYAQSVSGFVKDAKSGETLVGAIVLGKDGKGDISNSYGFYSLKVGQGKTSVTFQCMGYEAKTIHLDLRKDTVVNVLLEVAVMKVGDVVVQGEKRISTMQDLGVISMNINQLKLIPAFLGEQDVFRFMQLMPGVSSGKDGSSELNIRGGSADQTQILLDDVPIYNQSHAFGLISIFSGEAIKSAELFKGYSSPMYGGRLSGVASLYMRDGNKYEHKQSLQLGTTTLSATLEGPLKKGKGSYLFSGRQFTPYLLMQGIYACLSKANATLPQFNFYDVTGKLSYDLGKNNSLYLSFYKGSDLFGSNYWDSEREYNSNKVEHISKSKAGVRWGNTIASLRWNSVLNHQLFMNNTVYYSFLGNDKFSEFTNYREDYRYDSRIKSQMDEIGFKTNFNYSVTQNYKINYGANLSQQFFKPQIAQSDRNGVVSKIDYGKRDLLTVAAYVDNEYTYRKITVNGGLRVALYNNSEDVVYSVEPRVSLSYRIDRQSSIWVSYVNNAQPLFSLNKYYFSIPIDYWVPFSGKKIQRSNQFSLGYRKSFNGVLDISAEAYYKTSNNLSLVYDSDDFLLGEGGVDNAKGCAYGAEFSLQYTKNRFSFMASYTYSKSENKVDGKRIPFIFDTPHDLNLLAMYNVLKRPNRTHTLSLNVSYKTGLPYALSNESYKDAGDREYWRDQTITNFPKYPNTRLNDYFRSDINYSMEKKMRKGTRTWQISLLNATGYNNPYIVYKTDEKYKAQTIIPILPSFSYKRTF